MNLLTPSCPVTQGFGPSGLSGEPAFGGYQHFHEGMDYGCPSGTPILAPADGTITQAGSNGGFGNSVTVDAGNGLTVLQGHAQQIIAAVGAFVRQGQVIGYSGSTGYSTGPHVHYQINRGGTPLDPAQVATVAGGTPGAYTNLSSPISGVPVLGPLTDAVGNITGVLSNPETYLRAALFMFGIVAALGGLYLMANDASGGAVSGAAKTAVAA